MCFAFLYPRVLISPGVRNLLLPFASDALDAAASRATRHSDNLRKEMNKLASFGDLAAVLLAEIAN